MFYHSGLVFGSTEGVRSRFYVCVPGFVFGGTKGLGSRYHVLCARTRFRRYRGHRVPFSCFARSNSFSAVPRASGPVFIFCAPVLIFGSTEGVGSRFHVLRSRTHFRPVPRASGPVSMFCPPGLVFGGTMGVGSRFHVLRDRTRFRRYQGRCVPFSCFARLDSFSAVPRASGPVSMFYVPRLVFDGAEGLGSRFQVSPAQTRFRRYRGRRVPFFLFCTLEIIFGGTDGVGSYFHVLRARTRFRRYLGLQVSFFMFSAPRLVFGDTEGVSSRFYVLRARTRFRRYRGRRVPFSCFALPDSFSAVTRASGPVFMFFTAGLIFGGTEGVSSRFYVLRARTEGVEKESGSRFHFMRTRNRFAVSTVLGYQGHCVPFSCFARPDSFSAVPKAWGLVFMFCAPGFVFDSTEGVGSRFHVLRSRTRFRRYHGRRVPF
jgi:hypothetical protein